MPIVQEKTTFLARVYAGDGVDFGLGDAGFPKDVVPGSLDETGSQRVQAFAMLVQERLVDGAHFQDALGNAGEQRQVAADMRLDVEAGDLGAEQQTPRSLGTLKLTMPVSTTGLMTITSPPRARRFFRRGHQPRMVAGRVAADDEDEVGLFQVLERDARRASADGVVQADAAGLVAIVTAVADVVRAPDPGEELQQETSFVRAATAEVPERVIRRQCTQPADDGSERFVPGDGPVIILTAPSNTGDVIRPQVSNSRGEKACSWATA